jgi:tetratricopeptide (TPR) repeat protein
MMQRSYLILFFFLLLAPVVWGQEGSGETPSAERENKKLPESRIKGSLEEGARLIREKRWEEAIRLFEEMARRSPAQEEVYYHLGVSYLELGRFEKAEEALKRALRLNPEYTSAYLQLARLYEETQRLQEALGTYERIIEVDPMGEMAQFSLLKKSLIEGIFLARSGDFDGALRLFKSAAEIAPDDPAAHYNIGQVYLRKKNEAKAEEAFRKVAELDPGHQEARLHLGNLYERQKRMEEALEAFISAAQINPNSPGGKSAQAKIPLLQGILLAQRGKAEEALAAFRQALRISPDPAPIFFNIAQVYLGQGDFENAEAALSRTLQVDPKHQGALLNLGILFERQGKLEEALRAYETARDAQPASAEGVNAAVSAQTVRGRMAVQSGNLDEALEAFKQAAELQPKNPANYFNLALLHLRRNDLSEAEKAFDQVIALDPTEGDAYLPLADLLEKSGREQEAIETYERLIALGQGPLTTRAQVRLHLLKGVLFGRQQRFDDARSEFEEVVRLDPQEKMGYFNLALAHLKAKDAYAAADTLKKAVEIDPSDTAIRLRLASLYEELGRPYDALDLYQGVLEGGGEEPFLEDIQERINLLFGTISLAYQVTYDSNINLSENAFGDLKSDIIAQYQRFFLAGAGWRSGLRLTPSITMFHRSQISTFSGQLGLFVDWRGYQNGISLGYNLRVGLFEGSLSDRSQELSVDGFRPAGPSSTFTGSVRLRYADSVVNDVYDAIQPSISTSLAFDRILGGRLTLSGAVYANLNTESIGDDYAYVGLSPTLSFDRPLIQGVNLNLSYGYSIQSYLHPDSDFHERRINQGHSINGGVTVGLERGVQLYLRGSWLSNSSNLAGVPPEIEQTLTAEKTGSLSDYSKWLGMFGLRLLF